MAKQSLVYSALKRFSKLCSSRGPISQIYKLTRYYDEPLFYIYKSVLNPTDNVSDCGYKVEEHSTGCAIDKDRAVLKSLGEAIERYSLSIFRRSDQCYSIKSDLGEPCMSISVDHFNCSKSILLNRKMWWVKGASLITNQELYIPAQLIYFPYEFEEDELILQTPITTGAAAGSGLEMAIVNGFCEIAERDHFMIYYLNKLQPTKVNLRNTKNQDVNILVTKLQRYNLEVYVFDITMDLPCICVMAIIVDRTGYGPSISVGLKCGIDPLSALVGSIEEAIQTRGWIRDCMFDHLDIKASDLYDDYELYKRGLYWSGLKMISKLDFFLDSKKEISFAQFLKKHLKTKRLSFKDRFNLLASKQISILYKEVTTLNLKKQGINVARVIIPELQPLYLAEQDKFINSRTLDLPSKLGLTRKRNDLDDLNNIPHPFL